MIRHRASLIQSKTFQISNNIAASKILNKFIEFLGSAEKVVFDLYTS